MPIYRIIQDVYTPDPVDKRKMEALGTGVRTYVRGVLAPEVEVKIDKSQLGEGLPHNIHVHASSGDDCHYATGDQTECEVCHALACDEANMPSAF